LISGSGLLSTSKVLRIFTHDLSTSFHILMIATSIFATLYNLDVEDVILARWECGNVLAAYLFAHLNFFALLYAIISRNSNGFHIFGQLF